MGLRKNIMSDIWKNMNEDLTVDYSDRTKYKELMKLCRDFTSSRC